MTILYVSLSGKDFENTRDVTARETWVRDIDPHLGEGCMFLHGTANPDKGIAGFNTPEGHDGAWQKLCEMYKAIFEARDTEQYKGFKWFFFGDSDCFPMPTRMRTFLRGFESITSPVCIGRMNCYERPDIAYGGNLGHFNWSKVGPLFYVGGAGWVFNRPAMMKIGEYLTNESNPPWSLHYDVANGFWLDACSIEIMHSPRFRAGPFDKDHEMSDYKPGLECVTYHFMKPEEKVKQFYEILHGGR